MLEYYPSKQLFRLHTRALVHTHLRWPAMAANHHSEDDDDLPLTDTSPIFDHSATHSPTRARSSSSVSTTSLVLEHIRKYEAPERYRDEDDGSDQRGRMDDFDIEDDPLLQKEARPIDSRYRRWLWLLLGVAAVGWTVALVLFVISGSYKHRSTLEHDPDSARPGGAGSGKGITLDQLQSGAWRPHTQDISWIASEDGRDGLVLEKSYDHNKPFLQVEDVRAWQDGPTDWNPVVLMKEPNFKEGNGYVDPSEVWPSPDFKNVLICSDKQSNYRHSYTGRYWIFNVATQTAEPLDPERPNDRIQLATWSPKSDAVIFTRDNNMFMRKLGLDHKVAQVTTSGGVEMFNGVPDWVYEEEVFAGNSATWFSPSGKYVAFMTTNETVVPEFPVQYYVQRPSGQPPKHDEESYPEERRIKYPKAGAPNPVVNIGFYDVEGNSIFSVPITDDFADDDRIITEVIWAGDSDQVLIRETNRESDLLKMVLVNVPSRSGRTVRSEAVADIDGGWFEITEQTTYVPADPANGRPKDGYIDTVIHEGYDHLAYFTPIDSPKPKMLTSGKWEVADAPSAVDLKNNWVFFSATKDGSIQRHTYRVRLNGSEPEPMTDVERDGYFNVKFSKGSGYALVTYQGPKIPWQQIVSTPSEDTEPFQYTIEENKDLAGLASSHELPVKVYSTITVDDFELNVVERRPPHFDPRRRYPVLFFLYGGPGSQTVDKKFQVDFQSYVASTLGYIVVTVDGRGTGFLGRKTRCIVRGDLGHWEAYDQIETAKEWAKKDYVDANRIAIWGWSYGGYMTLKTLERDAGQTFRYGMAVSPVTDWRYYDSIYTERWMHTPQHNPDGYAASAVSNVTAMGQNVRFLIMHGNADDNVHFQNTLTLLDKFDMNSIENYDMHVFPDSDHSIYFHNANRMVYDKLSWWLTNAFNGEWAKIKTAKPLSKGQEAGAQ